jgi:hypothetical protein
MGRFGSARGNDEEIPGRKTDGHLADEATTPSDEHLSFDASQVQERSSMQQSRRLMCPNPFDRPSSAIHRPAFAPATRFLHAIDMGAALSTATWHSEHSLR